MRWSCDLFGKLSRMTAQPGRAAVSSCQAKQPFKRVEPGNSSLGYFPFQQDKKLKICNVEAIFEPGPSRFRLNLNHLEVLNGQVHQVRNEQTKEKMMKMKFMAKAALMAGFLVGFGLPALANGPAGSAGSMAIASATPQVITHGKCGHGNCHGNCGHGSKSKGKSKSSS